MHNCQKSERVVGMEKITISFQFKSHIIVAVVAAENIPQIILENATALIVLGRRKIWIPSG